MSFQKQYLADIGLFANPYPHDPGPRIASIYQTARRGRIDQTYSMQLWEQHLLPVYANLATIPLAQPQFDAYVIHAALAIEGTLAANQRGGFGIAQKIINLFFKDLWAFHIIGSNIEPLLHVPIDRGILNKLVAVPPTWNPWTAAVAGNVASATVADYLRIQNQYRAFLAAPAPPGALAPLFGRRTIIEMEQFLWHKL